MRVFCYLFLGCFASCQPLTNKKVSSSKEVYNLAIHPEASARHHYEIENETSLHTEVDGKELTTTSKSTVGVIYNIVKDSLGNYVVTISYDNIRIQSKKGDQETELDAANAAVTTNPVEKILGYLTDAHLTAIVDPKGQTKEMRGYKELGDKIVGSFAADDTYGRTMAQKEWETTLRKQLVDDNLKQLFQIFPDSLVHIGQTWKVTTRRKEQFNVIIDNVFTLRDIEDNIATIAVKGKIRTENNSNNLSEATTAQLTGTQEGYYKINLKTGLPVETVVESNAKGTMQAMGKEVPLKIENTIKVKQGK